MTLQFWDDLAHVASEHVKKGDRIYVSGQLVSDTVDEGPEKRHVYYKVSYFPSNTQVIGVSLHLEWLQSILIPHLFFDYDGLMGTLFLRLQFKS